MVVTIYDIVTDRTADGWNHFYQLDPPTLDPRTMSAVYIDNYYIPPGYTVQETKLGTHEIFSPEGHYCPVIERRDQPMLLDPDRDPLLLRRIEV